MAEQDNQKKPFVLHIQCRECSEDFTKRISPPRKNLTVICPFCLSFTLAVLEDFSLRPRIRKNPLPMPGTTADKKKKYRI